MSAGSERGPGARAASTDAEQSYTFDDLCLALGPGRGTPWEAPHKQAGPEPPGAGPGYDCGNGGRRTRTPVRDEPQGRAGGSRAGGGRRERSRPNVRPGVTCYAAL